MDIRVYPGNLICEIFSRAKYPEAVSRLKKPAVSDKAATNIIESVMNVYLTEVERTILLGRYRDNTSFVALAKSIPGMTQANARNTAERALTVLANGTTGMMAKALLIGEEINDILNSDLVTILLPDCRLVLIALHRAGVRSIQDIYKRSLDGPFVYTLAGFGAEKRRQLMAALSKADYPLAPIFTMSDILAWKFGDTSKLPVTIIPSVDEYPDGHDINLRVTLRVDEDCDPGILKVVNTAFDAALDTIAPQLDPNLIVKVMETALANFKDVHSLR